MKNSSQLIQLDERDNVWVTRQEIRAGEYLFVFGLKIIVKDRVRLGFKVAAKKIEKGEKIIKYGMPIGSATKDILPGEIVHVHNIKSDYSPTYTLTNQNEYPG